MSNRTELVKRTSTPTGTRAPSDEDSSGDEKAPLVNAKGDSKGGSGKGESKAEADANRHAVE